MSKKIFTKEQVQSLLQNPNVSACSGKSITYHQDFKVAAVRRYHEGLPPSAIFREAGFPASLLGKDRMDGRLKAWRKTFAKNGEAGLQKDGRATNNPHGKRGKHDLTNLSEPEKLKYYEAEIAYLKAENAFLAKLRKQR